ncbi:hypothetical protein SAMN03080594_101564 [Arenibacter palladensis]|uniref:DUF6250 domain-containing protein n=1 Tax=Arenibacter palladensis TaxID=237373 RepID=A0A1M4UBV2_9FLAO|nr:DUF6250 domain-containing protein [Arenibacter palladensis]SHE54219.1 hypothetical protein SAMN03080594_101564 [Arenibacter palladensis]
MKQTILSFMLIMLLSEAFCQKAKDVVIGDTLFVGATLLYEENFENGLEHWKVEQMPGGIVTRTDGKLEITDVAGCTIWFKKQLEGPIMIQYDACVIEEGGPQDRVSDLNCFWMAKDPENLDNLFANSEKRGGKFSNYDGLRLYYMGVGGHDNSKTRFRRYLGNGDRPLLPEHDLSESKYLITPNKITKIKIIAYNGIIQYYRDDQCIINFYDPQPYTSGHFGLRTVNNHMTVDNFKVFRLEEKK